MTPTTPRAHRLAAFATVAPLLVLGLGACGAKQSGGQPGAAPASQVSADQALAGQVPAAIRSDGAVVGGGDATYAPDEFLATDDRTVVGFDVDLFDAVAKK